METNRAARIAFNESTFRDVNEEIRRIGGRSRVPFSTYVCECGNESCEEQIQLVAAVYEQVRSKPNTFVVRTGHLYPDVECVVESHDGFDIIEKAAPAGRAVAEARDPRH